MVFLYSEFVCSMTLRYSSGSWVNLVFIVICGSEAPTGVAPENPKFAAGAQNVEVGVPKLFDACVGAPKPNDDVPKGLAVEAPKALAV